MIEDLLPPCVASAVSWGDEANVKLYPDETALLGRAVASRMREFATGRSCARRALRALGIVSQPILSGAAREPLWPSGVVGSITHCSGYRAAAVARQDDILSIGIDAEIHDALPSGVLDRIAFEELPWLRQAPAGTHWDRVLFSAKESVYKAWFPITGTWLGFEDVAVAFDPSGQTFEARILAGVARQPETAGCHVPSCFTGRYKVSRGLVLTAVAAPHQAGD